MALDGSDVRWSPDSRRVVFTNERGLVRFEVATGQSDEIVRGNVQWGWGWSFSPAGDEIAYSISRRGRCFGSNFDIYVVRVSGGTPRRLTTDGCSAFPVWGARGIAFARLISYRGWGRHEIWRMNPDGTGRRTVTGRLPTRLLGNGITGLIPFAWSDDGRRHLAGLSNEFGNGPFAVDPERGTIRKIDGYGYADWPHGLSRDGRYVLVSVGDVASYDRTRVEIVAYEGRRGRVIARRAGEGKLESLEPVPQGPDYWHVAECGKCDANGARETRTLGAQWSESVAPAASGLRLRRGNRRLWHVRQPCEYAPLGAK